MRGGLRRENDVGLRVGIAAESIHAAAQVSRLRTLAHTYRAAQHLLPPRQGPQRGPGVRELHAPPMHRADGQQLAIRGIGLPARQQKAHRVVAPLDLGALRGDGAARRAVPKAQRRKPQRAHAVRTSGRQQPKAPGALRETPEGRSTGAPSRGVGRCRHGDVHRRVGVQPCECAEETLRAAATPRPLQFAAPASSQPQPRERAELRAVPRVVRREAERGAALGQLR